jgi:amino acid adenylation domain-containing protein
MVGNLISIIPMRLSCGSNKSFAETVTAVQKSYISALPFSNVGVLEIQRICDLPSQSKLFNSTVAVQSFPDHETQSEFVTLEKPWWGDDAEGVMVTFDGTSGRVSGTISYEVQDVSPVMISNIISTMGDILDRICKKSNLLDSCSVDGLISLSDAEMLDISETSFTTTIKKDSEMNASFRLVHHGFEYMAAQIPNHVAVESNSGRNTITYETLEMKSNVVANMLRENGIDVDDNVAVLTGRSIEMVVAMFGALKASATYVPIDPSFPVDRINTMISEAKCKAILLSAETMNIIDVVYPSVVLSVSDILSMKSHQPSHLFKPVDHATERTTAFTVYTSGSTGVPKGVMVHHGGIARLYNEPLKMSCFKPGVRAAQFLNIGFDAAQGEVFFALTGGSTVVLRDNDSTFDVLKTVDVLHITPTGLSQLNPVEYVNLKRVFVGAEPLPAALADKWAHRTELCNLYGPTETSCFVSGGLVKTDRVSITIGRPLVESWLYVLDDRHRRVPVGVRGKLYVGGPCVTNGYLNSQEAQAKSFVKVEMDGVVMDLYSTGDEVSTSNTAA